MKRRLNNIFKEDGRAFIVAMDHGTGSNVLPDLKYPGKIIEACRKGGADGFLISPGMAKQFVNEIGNTALLLRADGGSNTLSKKGVPFKQAVTLEQAICLGADCVVCMDFPGSVQEEYTAETVARLVEGGTKWNFPVCVEPLPRGFEFGLHDDIRTPENIAMVARMAVERGADMVKVPYTGDKETFKALVESCYVPVLVLGGNTRADTSEFLTEVKDSLDAGASGVIIGRNIYQHENPMKMCQAIKGLIHDNLTVEEAVALLK